MLEVLTVCRESSNGQKYLHWDDLRRRKPPGDLTLDEWWFGVKMNRISQFRGIPLNDLDGRPFVFVATDYMQAIQRDIDLYAGGKIEVPDPITNPHTRDRYYISSLMEEAITSSQLEGAAVTRPIAKEMLRTNRKPVSVDERMILNNYTTMRAIERFKEEPLSKELILEIHRLITDRTLDNPSCAGRFRTEEERVDVSDSLTGEIAHVPPPANELEARIETLCQFANENDGGARFIHPVIRSIILHFWLAYDHPFVDGNGRVARALFYWSMLRYDYWLFGYVSISTILRKAPAKYSRAFLLTETDDNDLTYFIHYNLGVIQRAINELFTYVKAQTEEIHEVERLLGRLDALNRRQKALISHALRHPYAEYTYKSHRESHGVSNQTARTDILGMVDAGLLIEFKDGRNKHFRPAGDLEAKLSQLH